MGRRRKRKVAVFDVDGTIFRSSLLIQIVVALIKKGIFPKDAEALYVRDEKKWLDREGDYITYIEGAVRAFAKHIRGVHYSILADTAEELMEEQWRRTYRYTRDLILELKEKDYFLLAVSHSPKTVLDKFCPRFGFDKTYGTLYEIDTNECFTGNVVERHVIMNKAGILERAVLKENLTLTGSIGVGDTESDISFLKLVSRPICFNPNTKLYAYAKRAGWRVVVERKDVIYKL